MEYEFMLNAETLWWDAICLSCGHATPLCPLEEEPRDPDHVCSEVTNASLHNLLDAAGIEAVSRVMGIPEDY